MKLFSVAALIGENKRYLVAVVALLFMQSCATHKMQTGPEAGKTVDNFEDPKQVSHTFFLIGDAGNWNGSETPEVFSLLSERLKNADTSSTLIFLGDNVYP